MLVREKDNLFVGHCRAANVMANVANRNSPPLQQESLVGKNVFVENVHRLASAGSGAGWLS